MKTIPQISSQERSLRGEGCVSRKQGTFPLTNYNFQPTAEARNVSALLPGNTRRVSELHGFRKLSSEFLGNETSRDYVKEAILFTVIVAVSAWPIITMIAALARLVR